MEQQVSSRSFPVDQTQIGRSQVSGSDTHHGMNGAIQDYLSKTKHLIDHMKEIAHRPSGLNYFVEHGEDAFLEHHELHSFDAGQLAAAHTRGMPVEELPRGNEKPTASKVQPPGLLVAGRFVEPGSMLQQLAHDRNFGSAARQIIKQGLSGAMQLFDDNMVLESLGEKASELSHGASAGQRQKTVKIRTTNEIHARDIFQAIEHRNRIQLNKLLKNSGNGENYMPDIAWHHRFGGDLPVPEGVTPLGYTLCIGDEVYPLSKDLVNARANILRVDDRRNSVLHYAAIYGCTKLAKDGLQNQMLLKHINDLNSSGRSPLDLAIMHGGRVEKKESEIGLLLRQYGGQQTFQIKEARKKREADAKYRKKQEEERELFEDDF